MRSLWWIPLLFAIGCGDSPSTPDASSDPTDAATDAPIAPDAATDVDAGPPPDPPTLMIACDDAPDAIYAATADRTRPALDVRGEIAACSYRRYLSPADLAARLATAGVHGIVPTTGAHEYLVAYRTTRRGDEPAVSSARVLVPVTLRTTPSAMLVSAHGTTGVADACAPSRIDGAGDYLELPFASRGWPVIAPDYAGLGTEDVQGYGDNDDTGRSTLDAARALRALLPAATLSDDVVMTGHSQGGGSVLSAQALEPTYGAGGDLRLVIPFAPGWAVGRDVSGFRYPAVPTSFGGGAPAAIASLFFYAWGARALGAERAGEVFGAADRAEVVTALERDCVFTLASTIPAAAPTYGDLIDETFRTGVLSCADGGACTGTASQLWTFLGDNVLTPAAAGASVLVMAGTADTLATPPEVACIVDHLEAAGVTPTVCVDGSTHFDVVENGIAFAVDYAEAFLSSADAPACPGSASLPSCG